MNDAKNSQEESSNACEYIITVEQQKIRYNPADKTLLNNLETNDVEVHYHCRDGFCGACRVVLVDGNITYPNGEPLAFIGENEILPCCCVPTSDITLKIE
ncbi:class I ribonucleotide reductase maintenance protein YfaE [Colwelliaceae bacterium 6441]